MKKFAYTVVTLFLLTSSVWAQGEVDALRFSREDLHGTARSMSMGGAFGALGGDMTGVTTNPAGIAVYRSSEVVGTLNLSQERSKVGSYNANKTRFDMDNLGFVGYFPLRNDVMPLVNIGFSYNRLKSFDKKVSAKGSPNNTLIEYMAERATDLDIDEGKMQMGDNLPDPFETQDWLSTLGYNSYLIDPVEQNGKYTYRPIDTQGATPYNEVSTSEWGYVDNYDFTIGTTLANVLNLGFSLSVKDIFYNLGSDYLEDFDYKGGYTLSNWLKVNGAGVGAKLGAIYRPFHSIRLGLAWHSPTWYALTETFEAQIDDNMENFVSDPNYEPAVTSSRRFANSYDLKTPGKWVASVATILGNKFIGSMDWELTDYSKMKLRVPTNSQDDPTWYDVDNEYISEDFKLASTIKIGAEYRFTPQFSGRIGYAWMQNPYDDKGGLITYGEAFIRNSNTIHRIEGDTQYITAGLGYRFNRNLYLDMAFVHKSQTDNLYPFPNYYVNGVLAVNATPFSLTNRSTRALITLGYKF